MRKNGHNSRKHGGNCKKGAPYSKGRRSPKKVPR